MKAKHLPFWILVMLCLPTCTEPFFPELDEFDNLLVVDGTVTDGPGPYIVKLATSARLDITNYEPWSGADVAISVEGGPRYALSEVVAGEYHTDSLAFRGEVGKSYRVEVILPDGRQYESTYETLRENPGIDTVTAVPQTRYYDELQSEIPGYQFYVTSNAGNEGDHFYVWQMEGTYKYTSDYPIDFIYAGFLRVFDEPYKYFTCYNTYTVEEVSTADTRSLVEKRVIEKPLFFLRGDNKRLSYRYSLLTKQLTVSKEAYEFWDGVRKQSGSSTSLYNTQPYLIKGNVVNIDDDLEPVLGYFTVAGISEQRIYLNKPTTFDVTYATCGLDYDGYRWIFWEPASEWPIYIHDGPEGRAISGDGCMDCREVGGSVDPPSWWFE